MRVSVFILMSILSRSVFTQSDKPKCPTMVLFDSLGMYAIIPEANFVHHDSIEFIVYKYGEQKPVESVIVLNSPSIPYSIQIFDLCPKSLLDKYELSHPAISTYTDSIGKYARYEKIIVDSTRKVFAENEETISYFDYTSSLKIFVLNKLIYSDTIRQIHGRTYLPDSPRADSIGFEPPRGCIWKHPIQDRYFFSVSFIGSSYYNESKKGFYDSFDFAKTHIIGIYK